MTRALEPLFSLLDQGRESEAAEYLAWYVGGARRRGTDRVEVPIDRRTVGLRGRLEGLGFDVRSSSIEGKPVLEVRVAERLNP